MSLHYYADSNLQNDSTLILCIEDYEDPNEIDTRLFIGYDAKANDYFIRGKRQDIGTREYVPYAFHCDEEKILYDFIEFITSNNNISMTLYNFNNTNDKQDYDLTYEFFESNMDKNYEIVGYDNVLLSRDKLMKLLSMLKNMYNWDC